MYDCANVELDMHPGETRLATIRPTILAATATRKGPLDPSSLVLVSSTGSHDPSPASVALASSSGAVSGVLPVTTGASTPIVPIFPTTAIATHLRLSGVSLGPSTTVTPSTRMANITSLPPHFRGPSLGEGTRMAIKTTSSSLVRTCPSTFTSCPPTYPYLSTYTSVFVTTLHSCGDASTNCASTTTYGAPNSAALATRRSPVAIVAALSESGSPAQTISSLPAHGEPAVGGLGPGEQRTVIALTTVSGSVITKYAPCPTGAKPRPHSNGMIDVHPYTGTTISLASLTTQTTLVKAPSETGQSGNGVCACRVRKRSILMG